MNQYNEISTLQYMGSKARIIPSATPRKSFKTIMTPKGTLDGNYIVVFQKGASIESPEFDGTVDEAKKLAIECAERIVAARKEVTSQDLYDYGMLKDSKGRSLSFRQMWI